MNTDKIYAEHVANQYAPKQDSKVKALKRLDAKAKQPSLIFALTFGIIASLVLGTAMSLCMGVIGPNNVTSMLVGILVGLIGIAGMCVNYPIYKKMLTKSKNKYAADIIALAKEISEEE